MAARELAQRLISKHGRQDGVVRRPSDGATSTPFQPWKPGYVGTDPIVMQGMAVVLLDVESYRASFGKEASIAPEVSAIALIAAAATSGAILVGDTFETRTVRYSVVKAEVLAPGVEDILYTLQLKS